MTLWSDCCHVTWDRVLLISSVQPQTRPLKLCLPDVSRGICHNHHQLYQLSPFPILPHPLLFLTSHSSDTVGFQDFGACQALSYLGASGHTEPSYWKSRSHLPGKLLLAPHFSIRSCLAFIRFLTTPFPRLSSKPRDELCHNSYVAGSLQTQLYESQHYIFYSSVPRA